MATFVESPVTVLARPSEEAIAVTVHVFACRIQEEAIQSYCDTFLNLEPGARQGWVFQAAKGFGGLIALEQRAMPLGVAPSPPEFLDPRHLAGAPNVNKFTVSIPVWRYKCGANNILTEPEICWIQPILVFNNSTLVFQARESTGFDAFHGAIGIRPNVEVPPMLRPGEGAMPGDEPHSLAADVLLSTIVDFSPISPRQLLNFMTIRTGVTSPEMPPILAEEQDLEKTEEELLTAFPYFQTMLSSKSFLMRVLALKQFRGFPNIDSAVYQSLSCQTVQYTDIRDIRFYNPVDVDIKFYPTDMTRQIINGYLDLPLRSVIYGTHQLDRIERSLGEQFNQPPPFVAQNEPNRSPTPIAFCFDATLQPRSVTTLYTFR